MSLNKKKKIIIFSIGILCCLVFIFLPIKFQYYINYPGKVIPARNWILRRAADGSLTASFRNYKTGVVENYSAFQTDRSDAVKFQMNPDLNNRNIVRKSQTVATINSNDIERQLTLLKGQLSIARATLLENITGEKAALIQEAENKLSLAEEESKMQNQILERQKAMFEKNLIPSQDYEITISMARVTQMRVLSEKASLEALKTGLKPESIKKDQAQIEAIENEISVLEERAARLNIIAPFSGKLIRPSSEDTLLIIEDTKKIIMMGVDWENSADFSESTLVNIKTLKRRMTFSGKVYRVENYLEISNGKQLVPIYVEPLEEIVELPTGLIVSCKAMLSEVTPLGYCYKVIKTIFVE